MSVITYSDSPDHVIHVFKDCVINIAENKSIVFDVKRKSNGGVEYDVDIRGIRNCDVFEALSPEYEEQATMIDMFKSMVLLDLQKNPIKIHGSN